MKRIITGFFMSWGMFFSVPCPVRMWDEGAKLLSVVMLPFIGAVIGAVWGLCGFLLDLIGAPLLLTAAAMAVMPYLLSGFIHLDGFMDCCDAILSRRDLAERQRILKDSHTGAFAVICVCILMMFGFALFAGRSSEVNVWALIFVSACARCASAISVLSFKPIGHSGYAGAYEGKKSGCRVAAWIILAAAAVLPVAVFGLSGLCVPAAAAGAFLAILYGRHELGGMSGDISGYGITIGEICGAAVLLII